MTSFLNGENLEKMQNARNLRMRKAILLISLIAILFPGIFGYMNIVDQEFLVGTANLFCSLMAIICLVLSIINKKLAFTRDLLSLALGVQIVATLLSSSGASEQLFWAFPMMTAIIYINPFRVSLSYTLVVTAIGIAIFILPSTLSFQIQSLPLPGFHLIWAYFSLVVFALYFNYHSDKTNGYIQQLYRDGIEQLAYRDQLTGLANRWSFEKWAEKRLEECRYNKSITALVFLDIDDFKRINDSYGHEAGDRVLKHFATRLKNNIRQDDRVGEDNTHSIARFAGDEFLILLPQVKNKIDLDAIVKRIAKSFANVYSVDNSESDITFSIGISIFQQDSENLAGLIRCADRAMYDAKRSGKNQYNYYHNVKKKFPALKNLDDNITELSQFR